MDQPDQTMIEVHGAEDRYLRARGWKPAFYQKSKRSKQIRVWVKDGRTLTHTAAMSVQKGWDAPKWNEMDRVAARLLPEKYGEAPTPPVE